MQLNVLVQQNAPLTMMQIRQPQDSAPEKAHDLQSSCVTSRDEMYKPVELWIKVFEATSSQLSKKVGVAGVI